jgi:hypothetical protein
MYSPIIFLTGIVVGVGQVVNAMPETSSPTGKSPIAPGKRVLYILIHSTTPRSLRTVKDLISRGINGQSI